MKALMSYTSSVLEWLGRYGALVFGLLIVTACCSRPWWRDTLSGRRLQRPLVCLCFRWGHSALTLLWPKLLKNWQSRFPLFTACFVSLGYWFFLTSFAGGRSAGTVFKERSSLMQAISPWLNQEPTSAILISWDCLFWTLGSLSNSFTSYICFSMYWILAWSLVWTMPHGKSRKTVSETFNSVVRLSSWVLVSCP